MAETRGWPSGDSASEYLEKHKIPQLLENLSAQLLYHRPANPKAFMIEQMEQLMAARTKKSDYPSLFDEDNLMALVKVLDPNTRGYITIDQYKEAMKTLGITGYNEFPSSTIPGTVSVEAFLHESKNGLVRCSATVATES